MDPTYFDLEARLIAGASLDELLKSALTLERLQDMRAAIQREREEERLSSAVTLPAIPFELRDVLR